MNFYELIWSKSRDESYSNMKNNPYKGSPKNSPSPDKGVEKFVSHLQFSIAISVVTIEGGVTLQPAWPREYHIGLADRLHSWVSKADGPTLWVSHGG